MISSLDFNVGRYCVGGRKVLKYTDPTKALAETDLDRIQKITVAEAAATESTNTELSEQTAAQLSFNLPASSYATMALRELMKISTSVSTILPSEAGTSCSFALMVLMEACCCM